MFGTDADLKMKWTNKRLSAISSRGIPVAVAETLNNVAATARIIAIKRTEKQFIKRSTWLQRGMLFEKTRSSGPISRMESRVGNIRDFAVDLEAGATKTGGIQVPTDKSRITKRKKRRVARRFAADRISSIRRMPRVRGGAKARFEAMLNIARKEKYFGPFLVTERECEGEEMVHGVLMLTGADRMKKDGGKIIILRVLERTITIKGKPFIHPAAIKAAAKMDKVYIKNAQKVLRKFAGDIK